jgi:hypothetical protein
MTRVHHTTNSISVVAGILSFTTIYDQWNAGIVAGLDEVAAAILAYFTREASACIGARATLTLTFLLAGSAGIVHIAINTINVVSRALQGIRRSTSWLGRWPLEDEQ